MKESALQSACIDLLAVYERQGILTYTAIPNGSVLAGDERQRAIQMNKLKATGLRPGFPDLMIILPGKVAFAELKSDKGVLSPAQIGWRDALERMGFAWRLVRTLDEMKDYITELRG